MYFKRDKDNTEVMGETTSKNILNAATEFQGRHQFQYEINYPTQQMGSSKHGKIRRRVIEQIESIRFNSAEHFDHQKNTGVF